MTTKKKLLIKKIAGFDIESKKLKLSRLYIMKLTRDDRVIFKFGKAMNIETRLKAIQKDLTDWDIQLLWNSQNKGLMWLDVFTTEMEKLVHSELKGSFESYSKRYDDEPRGFTEMYDYNIHTDSEIIKFIETTIKSILGKPKLNSLEDLQNMRGNIYAEN